MTSYLEHPHWECASDDCSGRHSKSGESNDGRHEQRAIERDEAKLDECEGDGVPELCQDCFPSVGR